MLPIHLIVVVLQTLYVLSCRVTPSGGGEICRAAAICVLTIELRKVDPDNNAKADNKADTTLMYEVRETNCSLVEVL